MILLKIFIDGWNNDVIRTIWIADFIILGIDLFFIYLEKWITDLKRDIK